MPTSQSASVIPYPLNKNSLDPGSGKLSNRTDFRSKNHKLQLWKSSIIVDRQMFLLVQHHCVKTVVHNLLALWATWVARGWSIGQMESHVAGLGPKDWAPRTPAGTGTQGPAVTPSQPHAQGLGPGGPALPRHYPCMLGLGPGARPCPCPALHASGRANMKGPQLPCTGNLSVKEQCHQISGPWEVLWAKWNSTMDWIWPDS